MFGNIPPRSARYLASEQASDAQLTALELRRTGGEQILQALQQLFTRDEKLRPRLLTTELLTLKKTFCRKKFS